jgi:hypothetical protein
VPCGWPMSSWSRWCRSKARSSSRTCCPRGRCVARPSSPVRSPGTRWPGKPVADSPARPRQALLRRPWDCFGDDELRTVLAAGGRSGEESLWNDGDRGRRRAVGQQGDLHREGQPASHSAEPPGQTACRPALSHAGAAGEASKPPTSWRGRQGWGPPVVGMPGFEPRQPIPSRPAAYIAVRLTCMFTRDVCFDVQMYAHRL